MRSVAQRVVYILSLFCIAFAVIGVVGASVITVALAATGWFLARSALKTVSLQGDVHAPTPHVQYWGRGLLFRAWALMAFGVIIGYVCVRYQVQFGLSAGEELLLTALLISSLVAVTRFTLPGFFPASWEVHGAPERRKRDRSSMMVSRAVVRLVAAVVLVMSVVGSYTFFRTPGTLVSMAWHNTSTTP